MKKYKFNNIEKENPMDILNETYLIDENGDFNKKIKVVVDTNKVEDLTLKDFVNDGVEFLTKETQINNNGEDVLTNNAKNYAKIGSSGYNAQIGSSGDYAQIGSSGYNAKIGSSGDYAQIGSSGNYAKINVTGKNSICFACGFNSIIKAKKGTWFSLAEYEKKDDKWIPYYAKSAQIDNIEYVDYKGKILKENVCYTLVNKEFTPVIVVDNLYIMALLNKKRIQNYTIYKTQYLQDFKDNIKKFQFVAEIDGLTAHGETIEKAIQDVEFKRLKNMDLEKHAERIKEQGYFTAYDYRLITGACEYGTNRWLEENNFSWEDKKTIEEVLELTKGEYGHEILKEFIKTYF